MLKKEPNLGTMENMKRRLQNEDEKAKRRLQKDTTTRKANEAKRKLRDERLKALYELGNYAATPWRTRIGILGGSYHKLGIEPSHLHRSLRRNRMSRKKCALGNRRSTRSSSIDTMSIEEVPWTRASWMSSSGT